MAIVFVSVNSGSLVARNKTLVKELTDRNIVLIAVHVACDKYHTVIFGFQYLSLSKHKSYLSGTCLHTSWLRAIALPPQVSVQDCKRLACVLMLEYG